MVVLSGTLLVVVPAPPSGYARHLPINGEDRLVLHINGEDRLVTLSPFRGVAGCSLQPLRRATPDTSP